MTLIDEQIDKKARQLAINLQCLMAKVDYEHNRHEKCIVCGKKFKQHFPDGLPCENETDIKPRFRKDRWGNLTINSKPDGRLAHRPHKH